MDRPVTIAGFLASLRRARRWFGIAAALAGPLLAFVLGWLLTGLLPAWRPFDVGLRTWLLIGMGPWLLIELVRAWRRQKQVDVELDHALGLRDGLATWSSFVRTPVQQQPMFGWLEEDLEARIERLPAQRLEAARRIRLGPLRYLLPLVVLLLLLQEFAPLPPRLPAPRGPSSGAGGGGEQEGGGGTPQQQLQPPQPQPSPAEPKPQPEQPREPDPQPDPEPPADPKPLLQQPVEDQVVLPEFIGDGPTRRELAPVAELAQGGGAAAAGGRRDQPPPLPGTPEFEHAREEALRSRHVPPAERPFVRSYFEALAQRGR